MFRLEDPANRIDWRIVFGIVCSVVWLSMIMLYLTQHMNWQQFLHLPLDEIGSFLGGAFSPLAFLWLVIGFFVQQQEIFENSRNIETQAQHTNLDNFLKMAEIIYRHFGVITGFLFVSCREEIEQAFSEPLNIDDKWSRSSTGDLGIFARELLNYQFDINGNKRDMTSLFYGTAIRRRHSEKYISIFENLLDNARLCDTTGILYDSLLDGTVWGLFYNTLVEASTEARLTKEI